MKFIFLTLLAFVLPSALVLGGHVKSSDPDEKSQNEKFSQAMMQREANGYDNVDLYEDEKKDDGKTEVCYDELGCFDKSVGDRFPEAPDVIPPNFIFTATNHPIVNLTWNATMEEIAKKGKPFFDKEKRFVIIAHGFGESMNKPWIWNLTQATLEGYPGSVAMIIDWGLGAYLPLYNRAAANVPMIASMANRLVVKMMKLFPSIKHQNIHFIGFSLGGQMAGYFARTIAHETGKKIGRITALDAAAPLFDKSDIKPGKGQADFVEAVHTSGGNNMLTGKVGYVTPYADIDYFPNGGVKQPGCSMFVLPCSHQRAFVYWTHAMKSYDQCKFKGHRCANVAEANSGKCHGPAIDAFIGMRDPSQFKRLDNDYHIVYFETDSKIPFCKN